MKKIKLTLITLLVLSNILAQKKIATINDANLLEKLMKSEQALFSNILKNKDSLNVQIIYTQINRDSKNKASFKNFLFNVNPSKYFYPASTVKMPIAFLALEKLNELNIKGLDMNTTMITDSTASGETVVYNQPTSKNGKPTIANYIKQIFLVSDNDAYNRLYEFLGQEYILRKLSEKGYPDAAIRHRLEVSLTTEQNRTTNAIYFLDDNGKLIYKQEAQYNKVDFKPLNVKLGKGFYKEGKLLNEPFDFTMKNRVHLSDLQQMLQAVMFSKEVNPKKRFNLTEKDYKFVTNWLSSYPAKSDYPPYDTALYWDTYCKFLYYGSEKRSVNKNIRIYNKVGDAYGFLIDVAYIIDTAKKVEFMLSAAISCNSDGIYNDNKYDYDSIGYPFMKNIGETIYKYELKRKRKFKPNFKYLNIE